MPAVVPDADGSDYDERMADVGAWRPDGQAFGGFTEKVWTLSWFYQRTLLKSP